MRRCASFWPAPNLPTGPPSNLQPFRAFLTWAIEHLALEMISVGADEQEVSTKKEQVIGEILHTLQSFRSLANPSGASPSFWRSRSHRPSASVKTNWFSPSLGWWKAAVLAGHDDPADCGRAASVRRPPEPRVQPDHRNDARGIPHPAAGGACQSGCFSIRGSTSPKLRSAAAFAIPPTSPPSSENTSTAHRASSPGSLKCGSRWTPRRTEHGWHSSS